MYSTNRAQGLGLCFLSAVLVAAVVPAQDPVPVAPVPGGSAPSVQDPQDPSRQDPGAEQPAAASLAPSGARLFAVVGGDSVAVRCFPTDHSSFFEDVLPQGSPVQIGDTYGSYRQVFLPAGITGYVHKDFTTDLALEGEALGTIQTKVKGVSWRHQPQAGGNPLWRVWMRDRC